MTKVKTGFSVIRSEWSPDGRYLALDLLGPMHEAGPNQAYRTWYFLDALTGDLCSGLKETVLFIQLESYAKLQWPEDPYFFERRTEWVKDNRLLYISSSGGIQYLTPCIETVEYPLPNPAEQILRISETSPDRSQILLEGDQNYWLYLPERNGIDQIDLPPQTIKNSVCFKWSPWEEKVLLTRLEERKNVNWILIEHLDPQTRIRSNPTIYRAHSQNGWRDCARWLGKERYLLSEANGSFWLVDARKPDERINLFLDLFERSFYMTQRGSTYFGSIPGAGGEDFHIYADFVFRGDREVFLYHAESSILDKMPDDMNTVFLFPNGEVYSTILDETEPPKNIDLFRVIHVDAAEPKSIVVPGHLPRQSVYLQVDALPGTQQLLFSSVQGISLVDVNSGETLHFWRLDEPEHLESFRSIISPDGKTLVGFATRKNDMQWGANDDIYWLRLEP
jgi:hypothetical protein